MMRKGKALGPLKRRVKKIELMRDLEPDFFSKKKKELDAPPKI